MLTAGVVVEVFVVGFEVVVAVVVLEKIVVVVGPEAVVYLEVIVEVVIVFVVVVLEVVVDVEEISTDQKKKDFPHDLTQKCKIELNKG